MVLAELGSKLTNALKKIKTTNIVDKKALDDLLKEFSDALLEADVSLKLVITLKVNITRAVKPKLTESGINKRTLIERTCVMELSKLLESETPKFTPKKGKSNVIMFIGLQGSGKTTTITKMAYWYKTKGWSTAIVCADTFRAGAFDQVKQNAIKAGIPFYGSYIESDPVIVAMEGVERFKNDKKEIIFLDTSGRHKQEEALFEEMKSISKNVEPNNIVLIIDSSIGQIAYEQAKAFGESVKIGSVIITKLDGHAKGGGALSAVAATKSPIIFIGTGEHIDKFEKFNSMSFVSRLLGKWDVTGIYNLWNESKVTINEPELINRLMGGKLSLRDMRDQFQTVLNMGPGLMNMIPGINKMIPEEGKQESSKIIKQFMTLMDSMTNQELDGDPKLFNLSRKRRISRGAGIPIKVFDLLINAFKPFKKMGGNLGKVANRAGVSDINKLTPQQLASVIDPRTLKGLGGQAGLQSLMSDMKNMDSSKMQDVMSSIGSRMGIGNLSNISRRGRRRKK